MGLYKSSKCNIPLQKLLYNIAYCKIGANIAVNKGCVGDGSSL